MLPTQLSISDYVAWTQNAVIVLNGQVAHKNDSQSVCWFALSTPELPWKHTALREEFAQGLQLHVIELCARGSTPQCGRGTAQGHKTGGKRMRSRREASKTAEDLRRKSAGAAAFEPG